MMTKIRNLILATSLAVAAIAPATLIDRANAASSTTELNRDANQALQLLYSSNPAAASMGRSAKAVLIFPSIVKAGFVFGGAYGEGVLESGPKVDSYYNSFTGSWGLQAGAQSYGYVVFLMTNKAVEYIHATHGWEIGTGPTIVIVDAGIAQNLTTSTMKDDAYAFIFDQKGLMAGVSIEGTKISRVNGAT
jgi:lipid-binding SYLF domain-containing protein